MRKIIRRIYYECIRKVQNHKTAYLLRITGYVPEYKNISEVNIASVGRKYVTVANNAKFAELEHEENYLKEQTNCGWSRYLFAEKQDALDYVEKKQLAAWLTNFVNFKNDTSVVSPILSWYSSYDSSSVR